LVSFDYAALLRSPAVLFKSRLNMIIDNLKTGQYFYHIHRRNWGVWKKTEMGTEHIADYQTREEARDKVYELNHWNK
jgi:hypothetical protein